MKTLKVPSTPRTAVVWSVITDELAGTVTAGDHRIVDVGGGTGGFAVPLAQAGYQVTVVDPSPNALAGLTRRAADAGAADRVHAVQGDADSVADLVPPNSVRFALCHSVLEMVDSPESALRAIATVLAPGGAVSLLVANRAGAVLSRVSGGHLSEATTMLSDDDGRFAERDTLRRRFDPESIHDLVLRVGLVPQRRHGVQIATELVPGHETESDAGRALFDFELAVAGISPYRDIAAQVHILARKPS